jgi:hypothetical protein
MMLFQAADDLNLAAGCITHGFAAAVRARSEEMPEEKTRARSVPGQHDETSGEVLVEARPRLATLGRTALGGSSPKHARKVRAGISARLAGETDRTEGSRNPLMPIVIAASNAPPAEEEVLS